MDRGDLELHLYGLMMFIGWVDDEILMLKVGADLGIYFWGCQDFSCEDLGSFVMR